MPRKGACWEAVQQRSIAKMKCQVFCHWLLVTCVQKDRGLWVSMKLSTDERGGWIKSCTWQLVYVRVWEPSSQMICHIKLSFPQYSCGCCSQNKTCCVLNEKPSIPAFWRCCTHRRDKVVTHLLALPILSPPPNLGYSAKLYLSEKLLLSI